MTVMIRPLEPLLRDGILATAEALYPVNDFGAPDYRSTDLALRMLAYLGELPPDKGRLVGALFVSIELGAGLLGGHMGRFSRLPLAERKRLLHAWYERDGSVYAQLVEALKGALGMIYLSHPDVVRHMQSVKTCDRPWDDFKIDVDVTALTTRHASLEEVTR
jgi:hypothetical protein